VRAQSVERRAQRGRQALCALRSTLCALLLSCRTARGIVGEPAAERDPPARGNAAARQAMSRDDEMAIDAVILTRFFRPWGGQARWIDPRPLGDVRDPTDTTADADDAWADAIRAAAGVTRICVLDPDVADACRGREGGVVRFSHVYAAGPDTARVFVHWAPAVDERGPLPVQGQPTFEMVFTMARVERGWRIAAQRAINR